MLEQFQNLDPWEGTPQEAIIPKMLKSNADMICLHLTGLAIECVNASSYPDGLKHADVALIFEEVDTMNEKNCTTISLLPTIAKIYMQFMRRQLSEFPSHFLHHYLRTLDKGYNTQNVLFNILQYCKDSIDDKGLAGAVFIGNSKAFDCINHGLVSKAECLWI